MLWCDIVFWYLNWQVWDTLGWEGCLFSVSEYWHVRTWRSLEIDKVSYLLSFFSVKKIFLALLLSRFQCLLVWCFLHKNWKQKNCIWYYLVLLARQHANSTPQHFATCVKPHMVGQHVGVTTWQTLSVTPYDPFVTPYYRDYFSIDSVLNHLS